MNNAIANNNLDRSFTRYASEYGQQVLSLRPNQITQNLNPAKNNLYGQSRKKFLTKAQINLQNALDNRTQQKDRLAERQEEMGRLIDPMNK